MKITKREIAIALRLGTLGLIVGAIFSIANGSTLLGIAEFLAAELGILAARRFSGKETDTDTERRFRSAAMLAAVLLFMLSACAKPQPPAEPETTVQPTEQTHATVPAEEASWHEELAQKLLETYGVLPECYEDLGDGTCQVYVEVGGEIMPFAILNTATGEYQLIITEGQGT